MKKIIAILLSALIILAVSGCSSDNSESSSSKAESAPTTEAAAATEAAATETTVLPKGMDETIEDNEFEGVIFAAENNKTVASFAKGTAENGKSITVGTPLPVGSVSKQFCAAAVLLLQEQGKLSVKDTLDKYYPDFSEGKKVSLHNLLSMRSGIPEPGESSGIDISSDHTEEENVKIIKDWLFKQKLKAKPDTTYEYANINYFLLSDIVQQVSGKKYSEFQRENFFTPLNMTNTGLINELSGSPEWAHGNVYQKVDTQPGITNGAGDIISNAADLTAWINALSTGKVISEESFKAMTTDYSPDVHYGYGMYLNIEGGIGHYGAIGIYSAFDYINTDKKLTLVVLSNSIDPTSMTGLAGDLLTDLMS